MSPRIERVPLVGILVRTYRRRLTPRGQYLFWVTLALAVMGLDTRRTQVYTLFAIAAALFLVASLIALRPRPKASFDCRLPDRATALQPVVVNARVTGTGLLGDWHLTFPSPDDAPASFHPSSAIVPADAAKPAEIRTELRVARRGRYAFPGPVLRWTDPLRLATSRAQALAEHILLVYPRYYSMSEFIVPIGRRYQPGGIPLSSSTGDAIEFVGTREYREGDPVKNIHWRSWARRGEPVVKEYQEEYFCRIAIILDTFLPRNPAAAELSAFEAGISVVASVADYFSRSEYIVDILAAGPDIYEVSAGRSLAYLENILDVLACLEPCHDPPFATIGPYLFDKLAHITTVVAVLQDWDAPREEFLRRVRALGTAVRGIIVHAGPTAKPWQHIGEELGELNLLAPGDVEQLLAAEGYRG